MTTVPESRPIRIAFCITELEVGGAERALVELASRLDRSEFIPVVYSLGPRPASPRDLLVRRLESAGIPLRFLDAKGFRDFPLTVWRLARLLRQQRPDLLQSFLFHANFVGRLAAGWAGVPHVVAGIRVAEHDSRWHLWLDRATSGLVERYACVSEGVASFSKSIARLPPEKLVVIPNGVDLSRFGGRSRENADLGLPPGQRLIVYAGRLESQKRVDWLLGLAPRFFQQLPGHLLVIAGDGPLAGELRQLNTQLGLDDRVRFLGWRGDLPAILQSSDLLVLPSAWEGMPQVVLEAMACGKPVVATDVEGVRQALGAAADGQVVAPDDKDTFVHNVIAFCQNPPLSETVGRRNRSRVEQAFTIERMVEAYEGLYRRLVAKAGAELVSKNG